jgi:hypothetical protein
MACCLYPCVAMPFCFLGQSKSNRAGWIAHLGQCLTPYLVNQLGLRESYTYHLIFLLGALVRSTMLKGRAPLFSSSQMVEEVEFPGCNIWSRQIVAVPTINTHTEVAYISHAHV